MQYNEYRYIYPPRPERKINPVDIGKYDNGEFVAQPKYNGDCSVVALHADDLVIRNRHDEPKDHVDKSIDFKSIIARPGWLVICGEMLDKAKKDEHGNVIKGFVIFDILVCNSVYLLTFTVQQRLHMLDSLFPATRMRIGANGIEQYKHLLFTEHAGIYRAPVYTGNFAELYADLIKTDCYEGIVLKKLNAKLEVGFNSKNNSGWQIKIRKPSKLYHF